MKIQDATLSMDAFTHHKEVKGTIGIGSGAILEESGKGREQFRLQLPTSPPQKAEISTTGKTPVSSISTTADGEPADEDSETHPLLQKMVEGVIGRRVRITQSRRGGSGLSLGIPFSMSLGKTLFKEEVDTLHFSSHGSVKTEDGRTLDFSLQLSLEQRRTVVTGWRSSLPYLMDPLVLSFDRSLSTLADTRFSFDLDLDGEMDEIPSLHGGSGFLALDKNEDGVINNGAELFGPLSGAGFTTLQEYDFDGNKWIDENDPVFDQLMVWFGAGGPDDRLVSLREAGVGALSLTAAESLFDLKDSNANVIGRVSGAGLFFLENGEARSLQEVDLSMFKEEGEPVLRDKGLMVDLQQALRALQAMIERRQREIAFMTRARVFSAERSGSLFDKFWRWQEKDSGGGR